MKFNQFDEFINAAEKGDGEKMKNIGNTAAALLSEEQKKIIEKAMSDPDFLNSLLSSPKAKEIIKKISGGNK